MMSILSSTSPPPLVQATPPPLPGSYICNNISLPLHHQFTAKGGWSYPVDTSSSKTVVCSPQDKPCNGHYELTTWYPLYPQTAPSNPAANSGSPGMEVLSYTDLRCVDGPATPKEDRFSFVQGPLPDVPGEAPISGATDKEVCEHFATSPALTSWVNQQPVPLGAKPGPYFGLTMWNSIQSGMPLIKCQVNTKPSDMTANFNGCTSGQRTMEDMSPPSPPSPSLSSPKPPYQVTCKAIPHSLEFNIVKSSISDVPSENEINNQSQSGWSKVAGVKAGGQVADNDINNTWSCTPDERTTFNGIDNDDGTTYTCTGFTDDINGIFMIQTAEKISCDKPDFAKCVSSLYNHFQQTFISPSVLPPTYGGTCTDLSTVDCGKKDFNSCSDNPGCMTFEQCETKDGLSVPLLEQLCKDYGYDLVQKCVNERVCEGDMSTSCTDDSDCTGDRLIPGKPPIRFGEQTCSGIPTFVQKKTDPNVWVPSSWPSVSSPLPQVLETNHDGASCSGYNSNSGLDLATMVQQTCSMTQLGSGGELMKYVTVYDKDMTDTINQALYANLNSGCLQHCDIPAGATKSTGTCSGDKRQCTLDSDCTDMLIEVFVPEYQAGTCSQGSCGEGPMKNYPCKSDAECAGSDIVDVRTTGKLFKDRCAARGGTWRWYEDQTPDTAGDSVCESVQRRRHRWGKSGGHTAARRSVVEQRGHHSAGSEAGRHCEQEEHGNPVRDVRHGAAGPGQGGVLHAGNGWKHLQVPRGHDAAATDQHAVLSVPAVLRPGVDPPGRVCLCVWRHRPGGWRLAGRPGGGLHARPKPRRSCGGSGAGHQRAVQEKPDWSVLRHRSEDCHHN